MQIIIQKEFYSKEQCDKHPRILYVFGDNTKRIGTGGQATIRDRPNSFGVCTKWAPSNSSGAFFTDTINCLEIIEQDIEMLSKVGKDYTAIVFPSAGLGTGLSDMPNKCPLLYKRLLKLLKDYFKIDLS